MSKCDDEQMQLALCLPRPGTMRLGCARYIAGFWLRQWRANARLTQRQPPALAPTSAEQLWLGVGNLWPLRPGRPTADPRLSLGAQPQVAVDNWAARLTLAEICRTKLGWNEPRRPAAVGSRRVALSGPDGLSAAPACPAHVVDDTARIAIRVDLFRGDRSEPWGRAADRLRVASRSQGGRVLSSTRHGSTGADQRQHQPSGDSNAAHQQSVHRHLGLRGRQGGVVSAALGAKTRPSR